MKKETEHLPEEYYRTFVFERFQDKSDGRFSNGAPQHASYIFEAMFTYAQKSVEIFCKNLSKEVFSDKRVYESLKKALKRNVFIRIVTQNTPDETDFSKLASNENLIKISQNDSVNKLTVNFAIMDKAAFRYEESSTEIKAIASANEPATAKMLSNDFAVICSV